MKRILYLFLSTALSVAVALGATDPFLGKWQMNVQQSNYAAGTCPVRMFIEMEGLGAGVRYRSETTLANGRISQSQYTADYDGREAIVIGTNGLLTPVALKRLAPNIVVASYRRGFQVTATSRREVSGDGRIMTITTTSTDRDGKVVTNIGVYEKVAAENTSSNPRQ